MKKALLLGVLISGLAFGQTKKLASSDVHWWGYKIAKTEASSHDGTVNVKSGNLVLKNGSVVGGQFVLDMTTINATDLSGEYQGKLNGHLKNGDFFEVEKYPEMTFVSTSTKKVSDTKFTLTGNLTMHGVTKPVTLAVDYYGSVVNPMNKKETFGFHIAGTLKRTEFGIAPNFPTQVVGDDISIVADAEFVKE